MSFLWAAGSLALASAWAAVAYAQPTVVVNGDATCPSADMVREALAAARPEHAASGRTVTVEVANDRLSLTLGDAPAVRREIPADADCSVRAESIAVVIAAWSGELASRPTDSPLLTVASLAPVLAPPPRHVLELDGGAFYSPWWGHAPGAALAVGRTPRQGGLGARVLGAYQAARDLTLEGGSNQILRFMLGAAVTYDYQIWRVFVSGALGLLGTFTRAQGDGYETNRAESTSNFGGFADLRVGFRLGRFRLWPDARLARMVRTETVKIQSTSPNVADSATLDPWDLQLGVGLGYRFE
jgi:hypothetical protein